MKKTFSLIFAVIFLITLCGCKGKNESIDPSKIAATDSTATSKVTENTVSTQNSTGKTDADHTEEPSNKPTETEIATPTETPVTPTETPTITPTVCNHSFKVATCTAPKTCTKCNVTEGSPTGHSWKSASCTIAKTCSICNTTEGSPAGHSWKSATCTTPKTCRTCGATEGSTISHTYVNDICSVCNSVNGLNPKENIIDGLDYVGKFHEPSATAPALMFNTEASGCFVTTRYFTTDPEEASSGGWDYNGSHYYSVGGGFTPYRAQITDTELIVTSVSYLDDDGTVSIKAIMLNDGNLKITYSTLTDYPVGLILYADIANAFK